MWKTGWGGGGIQFGRQYTPLYQKGIKKKQVKSMVTTWLDWVLNPKHTHLIFDLHTIFITPLTLQPLRLAFCRCCYDRYAQVSVKVTRQLTRTNLPVMPKALFRLSTTLDRSKVEQFYFFQFLLLLSSQVFTQPSHYIESFLFATNLPTKSRVNGHLKKSLKILFHVCTHRNQPIKDRLTHSTTQATTLCSFHNCACQTNNQTYVLWIATDICRIKAAGTARFILRKKISCHTKRHSLVTGQLKLQTCTAFMFRDML